MITITLIEHSGESHRIETETGVSLMEAAIENAVPGIDADCGGGCACGTCHVKVAQRWRAQLDAPSPVEISMLELTPEKNEDSRLACQITLSQELDGLSVQLPEFQM